MYAGSLQQSSRGQFGFAVLLAAVTNVMFPNIGFAGSASGLGGGFSVEDAVTYEWYVDLDRGVPVRASDGNREAGGTLRVWEYSTDKEKAVFLTRRGDMEHDRVQSTVHLVQLIEKDGRVSISHRELVKMYSYDSDPPIRELRWVGSENLAFVGTAADQSSQVFTVDLGGNVTQLTEDLGEKFGFDVGTGERIIVYGTREQPDLVKSGREQPGLILGRQILLFDLLGFQRYGVGQTIRYWLKTDRSLTEVPVPPLPTSAFPPFISVSPSGNYAVVASAPTLTPFAWESLDLRVPAKPGSLTHWSHMQLFLVDLLAGKARPITGAPMADARNEVQIVWDEERNRLFAVDQFLLPGSGSHELDIRTPVTIAYALDTGKIHLLDRDCHNVDGGNDSSVHAAWYAHRDRSLFVQRGRKLLTYSHEEGGWVKSTIMVTSDSAAPDFLLKLIQDVATPAQMTVSLDQGLHFLPVGDINEGLKGSYNPSREFAWRDTTGIKWRASLTLPRGGSAPFPLVIQSHGFSPAEFVVTGDRGSSAGFSAQALASEGFAVLMVGDPEVDDSERNTHTTPNEYEIHTQGFRSAIEALTNEGLVSSNRVGIIAWSGAGLYLQHALAFADGLFDVAIAADAASFGTLSFIYYHNFYALAQRSFLKQNAVRPYGEGLDSWRKTDPLTKIGGFEIPILIQDFEDSFPSWWQAYVAMAETGKPVEYYSLRQASHAPQLPSHQLAVQSLSVDWLKFWLQGYEDAAPEKAEQYVRWRKMREERCAWNEPQDQEPVYCKYSDADH